MQQLIIEIQSDRRISVRRGFLIASKDKQEIARIPLDDLSAVVTNGHGIILSNNILCELADRGVPVLFCGVNHKPTGLFRPVACNYRQAERRKAQFQMSNVKCGRIWKRIVKAKLAWQAENLRSAGKPVAPVEALIRQVRTSDSDNREAVAAKRYWSSYFGKQFRRDRKRTDQNALLNYGYTVLRAATARAVIVSGLEPSGGVNHRSQLNELALVDDIMEPGRPLIDAKVLQLCAREIPELTPEVKKSLAGVIQDPISGAGTTPLQTHLYKAAMVLASQIVNGKTQIYWPLPPNQRGKSGICESQYSPSSGIPIDVDARYV